MNASQISTILRKFGFETGVWTTLYSQSANIHLGLIGLQGDNNLVINPTNIQFYFDNENGLLYYRTYTGKAYTERLNNEQYEIVYEGKKYYMRPLNCNIEISGIGKVAGAVCYQNIVGFYPDSGLAKHY